MTGVDSYDGGSTGRLGAGGDSALGVIGAVRGAARIEGADGIGRAALIGGRLSAHDVVILGEGARLEIRLGDGHVLGVGGGGRCSLAGPIDTEAGRALSLRVLGGSYAIHPAAAGAPVLVVETAVGRLVLDRLGVLLEVTAPDAIRFAAVGGADAAQGRLIFTNAQAGVRLAGSGEVVSVAGADGLPQFAGDAAACSDFAQGFASEGLSADELCTPAEAAIASAALEPLPALSAGESIETSAGGDEAALAGDAFRVTAATTAAFDLASAPATLVAASPPAGAASVGVAGTARHTAEALFQNQPAPSPEIALPEPLILRAWDPGRRWEGLGQVDEFAGQARELPLEATRLIAARQGEMAVLEATDVSRLQIEEFLGLNHGALAALVPGTNPGAGAAMRALNTISLAAGETIRFDTFFDAAGAATLNDFAVFTVAVGGQSLALPIASTATVGDFDASGWQTIAYTAGAAGRYTFGFAVLNDGPAVALSRLYVDNVRRDETSDFAAEVRARIEDSLGGSLELAAPAPVAVPDALTVGEDGILAGQPASVLLANDRDPDPFDAPAIVGLDRTGTIGRLAIGDGSFSYDPAGRFEGLAAGETATDRFSYLLDGGNGVTSRGVVSVTITGANDAPIALADAALAQEGGAPVSIAVVANDFDADSDDNADSLRVVAAAAQSGATVRFVSTPGAPITYVPLASGDITSDTITYTIEDRHGARATGSVAVTIAGRNDAPLAGTDVAALDEDGVVAIDVLANDRDPDGGGTLTIGALDLAGSRGAVVSDGATVRYTAAGHFEDLAQGQFVSDRFAYTVRDPAGAVGTAAVIVTVSGRNDAPLAQADRATAREHGDPVTIDVLANDDDIDSDDGPATLTVVAASAASGAAVSLTGRPGEGIVYAADAGKPWPLLAAGASAVDVITYTVEDRWGARAEGTVMVTVEGVNDPVHANPDALTVAAGAPTVFAAPGLLANDTDPDGTAAVRLARIAGVDVAEPLTVALPSGAILTAGPDGAAVYNPNGVFDALAAGERASDGFEYTVSDGLTADTARVTVTVIGGNDAPIANADALRISEDVGDVAIAVLANDDDIDADDTAASLRVIAATAASGAEVRFSGRPGEGVAYAPAPAYQALAAGEIGRDTLTYTIADRHGATATAAVSIEITGINDRPVAAADRYNIDAGGRLDLPANLGLLANDGDADAGDRLGIVAVDGSAAAVGTTITLASGALLTVAADGSLAYDPNGRFAGLDPFGAAIDGFSYTVADHSGARTSSSVEIRIFKDNQPPVAEDDVTTTAAGTAIRIPVLLNDVDPERALLRIAAVDTGETRGSVRVNDDGTLTYDPNGAFSALALGETATDRFTYVVDDNIGGRDAAWVSVTVRGTGTPALGPAEELVQSFEAPFGLFVAGWAREPGAEVADSPVRLSGAHAVAGTTFTPTHFERIAVIEGRGASARGFGEAPSAIEAFLSVAGGTLPADDGRHAGEAGDGSAPDTAAAVRTELAIGDGDRDAAGRVSLAFDWNFVSAESVADNLPGRNDYALLTITDGTRSRAITLADAREIGLGASGWRTTTVDLGALLPLGATTRLTIGFAVVNDESSASVSSLLLDNVRLHPRLDDSLQLARSDEGGAVQTWRAPPLAQDDGMAPALATDEDHALTIAPWALLGNDEPSPGAAAASLAIVAVDASGARGRVSLGAGGVVYDPSDRFDALADCTQATDSFAYTITDANGGRASARATITIIGRNDAPLAQADAALILDGSEPVGIEPLVNDRDADDGAQALRLIGASAASGAVVRFSGQPGEGLVYDPGERFRALSAGETATDTIAYRVSDPHGATAGGLVTVTITGVNAAPTAADDALRIDQNTVATLALTANDGDDDRADRLAIAAIDGRDVAPGATVTLASGARVTVTGADAIRYDPGDAFIALAAGDETRDVFSYRIEDGFGGSDAAEVQVSVFGLNDAPVAGLDMATTAADGRLFLTPAELIANDADPDRGDTLRFVDVDGSGARGAVGFDGERVVYDPAGRFAALGQGETAHDAFAYRIADDDGLTAAGAVQVTVIGLNDPPTAAADSAGTDERGAVTIPVLGNDSDPDANDHLAVTSIDTRGTLGSVSLNPDGTIGYDPAGRFDALTATESVTDTFGYIITDGAGRSASATVTVTVTGRNDIERLVDSFETPLSPANRTSTFATTTSAYQETDGERGSFQPTDGAAMARLEARGSPIAELERFLGLTPGALPKDSDGSSPAFGSALKVRTTVAAGDEVSFDWMFDGRDAVTQPADGFADNDYAVVVINDATGTKLFKLADMRAVGDHGATGWQTSMFEAERAGDLVIGFGVINDRSPEPLAENSFLLVDNLSLNRDLDEGYRSVASEHDGGVSTLTQATA